MAKYEFASGLKEQILSYIEYRTSIGFNPESYRRPMVQFDKFCVSRGIVEPRLNRDDVDAWIQKRSHEANRTHSARIGLLNGFLKYLFDRGYDVPPMVMQSRKTASDFQPHIYSDDEVMRYFKAVDSFRNRNARNGLQYPVLFRILYCCGTRVGETLSIKIKDLDLDRGLIFLRHTKGKKERIIALGEDLWSLMRRFWALCLSGQDENDLVFTSLSGKKICQRTLYEHHRQFLLQAGIPFVGGGRGPRQHDWRHHMGVCSFKRMSDLGMDMYVALPILSTYLGHTKIYDTEKYLRLAIQHYPEVEKKFGPKVAAIFGDGENDGKSEGDKKSKDLDKENLNEDD